MFFALYWKDLPVLGFWIVPVWLLCFGFEAFSALILRQSLPRRIRIRLLRRSIHLPRRRCRNRLGFAWY